MLEYFDLTSVEKSSENYTIHLVEKNLHPAEFKGQKLSSKGYFDEITVNDFPIRGKACFLKVKRRKWLNEDTGKLVSRNWELVAKGNKGCLVAMIKGTDSERVKAILLRKIPLEKRKAIKEVTLDMAASMEQIVKRTFTKATLVTDRFHVQKLANDAVQQMRIEYRWQAIEQETKEMELSKELGKALPTDWKMGKPTGGRREFEKESGRFSG